MSVEKIRGIAFIVIGVISVICKLTLGHYNSDYVFNDLVSALGNILLIGGFVLITIGITGIMAIKEKEKEEILNYKSEE